MKVSKRSEVTWQQTLFVIWVSLQQLQSSKVICSREAAIKRLILHPPSLYFCSLSNHFASIQQTCIWNSSWTGLRGGGHKNFLPSTLLLLPFCIHSAETPFLPSATKYDCKQTPSTHPDWVAYSTHSKRANRETCI